MGVRLAKEGGLLGQGFRVMGLGLEPNLAGRSGGGGSGGSGGGTRVRGGGGGRHCDDAFSFDGIYSNSL